MKNVYDQSILLHYIKNEKLNVLITLCRHLVMQAHGFKITRWENSFDKIRRGKRFMIYGNVSHSNHKNRILIQDIQKCTTFLTVKYFFLARIRRN